jgi:DNA polymerase elongation subunit (family B)
MPVDVDGKKLTNVGGEVICAQKGFSLSVMAVDAASMYPAQIEANNVCPSAEIKPRDMRYMLQNWEEFGIQDVKTYRVLDMYSPYKRYTSM